MGGFGRMIGLTLLEVVVALVLISLITTAFVPAIAASVKFINRAWERYQYYTEARSQVKSRWRKRSKGCGQQMPFPSNQKAKAARGDG